MTGILGSFEPGFYGITLVYADKEAVDLFASYQDTEDLAGWSRAAGTEFGTVSLVSAPDHETRHFHDFLLSPAGASLMALQAEASLTGMQAFLAMMGCPQRYVPVPAVRWMDWDEAARARWVEATGRYFGIDSVLDFIPLPTPAERVLRPESRTQHLDPQLPPDRVLALQAEATIRSLGVMARMRQANDFDLGLGSFSADDAFEGSAHVIQQEAIWLGQSEAAADQYLAHLKGGTLGHHKSYAMLLNALGQASNQVSITRLSELYTWMLLTEPGDPLGMGNPGLRFAMVLILARREPERLLADMTAEQLWDLLDRASSQTGWRRNMLDSLTRLEAKRNLYSGLRESFGPAFFGSLLATADLWLGDSISVTREFLADPAGYANPLTYMRVMRDRLPLPVVRHHFHAGVQRRERPLASPGMRAITWNENGLDVIAYVASPRPDLSENALDQILAAMATSFYVDYCFFGEPSAGLLNDLLKAGFKELIRKEIVHVY